MFNKFKIVVRIMLSFISVHLSLQTQANSLRDSKGAEFQTTFARFDSKAINFLALDSTGAAPVGEYSSIIGQSIPAVVAMRNEASAYWRDVEPKDYNTISLLYQPFCLARVNHDSLLELNLISRRNEIANQIEANFQKFGNIETPDFFRLVESARVFRSNLSTLSQSLEMVPVINAQIDSLQEYISNVKYSRLLNLISSQLANSANISESVNSLYALKATTSDSTETEIIDKVISVMNELNKLPLQIEGALKQTQIYNASTVIASQITFYKTMVSNWQEKLQSSYNETKATLDNLENNIAYARSQMADATASVDTGLAAINQLEAQAESVAVNNFKQIDARLKEIIIKWHEYIKSSGDGSERLRQYVIRYNYVGAVSDGQAHRGGGQHTMTMPGCVDYSE